MLSAGVHGILPHYARQLSDAAASICKCLKQCLEAHSGSPGHLPHSNKRVKLTHNSSPSEQHQQAQETESDTVVQQQWQQTESGTAVQQQWQQKQADLTEPRATGQQQQQQQQPDGIQHQTPEQLSQQSTLQPNPSQQLDNQQQHQHQQQPPQHPRQQQQQQQQASSQQMHRLADSVGTTHKEGQLSTHELNRAEPTQGVSLGNVAAAAGSQDGAKDSEQQETLVPDHRFLGDLPSEGQNTATAAEGGAEADGIWQVLAAVAVTHHQDLHEKLVEQCREEDMHEAAGLKLADREDFEQLASMADFGASNLALAGPLVVPC